MMLSQLKNEMPIGIIDSKLKLRQFLSYEYKQYGRKNVGNPLILIRENDYLWRHNILLRRSEYYKNTNKKLRALIYRVLLLRFQNKYSIHIPLNTFGCGLKLMHIGPILVNGKARGGRNIALHINTSIVAGGVDNGAPALGDGVVVGVGAVILGNVTIAKNIAVGANSVVNKSFVEENIAIAGIPAKKISNNGRQMWNKGNIIEG